MLGARAWPERALTGFLVAVTGRCRTGRAATWVSHGFACVVHGEKVFGELQARSQATTFSTTDAGRMASLGASSRRSLVRLAARWLEAGIKMASAPPGVFVLGGGGPPRGEPRTVRPWQIIPAANCWRAPDAREGVEGQGLGGWPGLLTQGISAPFQGAGKWAPLVAPVGLQPPARPSSVAGGPRVG